MNRQEVNVANGDNSFKNFGFKEKKEVRRLDQGSWRVKDILPALPGWRNIWKLKGDGKGWDGPKNKQEGQPWEGERVGGVSDHVDARGTHGLRRVTLRRGLGSGVGCRTPPPSHNRWCLFQGQPRTQLLGAQKTGGKVGRETACILWAHSPKVPCFQQLLVYTFIRWRSRVMKRP